jgi:hypothetical protein
MDRTLSDVQTPRKVVSNNSDTPMELVVRDHFCWEVGVRSTVPGHVARKKKEEEGKRGAPRATHSRGECVVRGPAGRPAALTARTRPIGLTLPPPVG